MRLPGARGYIFCDPQPDPVIENLSLELDSPTHATAKVGLAGRHRRPGRCERRQRAALCFDEGVEATTAVNFRITPSDLLKT